MTPKYSKQQGISFIPLDFEQQAYYIDNTRMMLGLLIEFAENSNDTVVKLGVLNGNAVLRRFRNNKE